MTSLITYAYEVGYFKPVKAGWLCTYVYVHHLSKSRCHCKKDLLDYDFRGVSYIFLHTLPYNNVQGYAMYYHVIMHVEDPWLSVIRLGHCVPLVGFWLFLYSLHMLDRDVNVIQKIIIMYRHVIFALCGVTAAETKLYSNRFLKNQYRIVYFCVFNR